MGASPTDRSMIGTLSCAHKHPTHSCHVRTFSYPPLVLHSFWTFLCRPCLLWPSSVAPSTGAATRASLPSTPTCGGHGPSSRDVPTHFQHPALKMRGEDGRKIAPFVSFTCTNIESEEVLQKILNRKISRPSIGEDRYDLWGRAVVVPFFRAVVL